MKAEKVVIKSVGHARVESHEEACEAALLYLLRKYCEGGVKLDSIGISTGINRGTGREGLLNGGSGK